MGSYCLTGVDFSFYKMIRVLEMDDGDGCSMLQVI